MGGLGSGPTKVKRGAKVKLHTPDGLVEGAKPYFRSLAQRAAEHGLAHADGLMLGQLATALWLADQAAALIAKEGMTVQDTAHNLEARKHPAVSVWRAAVGTADALAKQFGLTPSSRARLGLAEDDEGPSMADVLFSEAAHHGGR